MGSDKVQIYLVQKDVSYTRNFEPSFLKKKFELDHQQIRSKKNFEPQQNKISDFVISNLYLAKYRLEFKHCLR